MNPEKLLNPFTVSQLKRITKRIKTKDTDFVIVIEGRERSGKSTLALIIDLICDHDFSIKKNIVFNKKKYVRTLKNLSKYSVLHYDEAGIGLYKRDASTKDTKIINKLLMTVGQRNLLHLYLIPSFFEIDPYLRTHRIDLLIRVVSKGKALVYSKERLRKIFQDRTKKDRYPPHEFTIYFKRLTGQVWKEYQKYKGEQLQEYLKEIDDGVKDRPEMTKKDMIIQALKRSPKVSSVVIAKALSVDPSYVRRVRCDYKVLHE